MTVRRWPFSAEDPITEEKRRWFQSLTVEQRLQWNCDEYERVVEAHPELLHLTDEQLLVKFPHAHSIQVLEPEGGRVIRRGDTQQ